MHLLSEERQVVMLVVLVCVLVVQVRVREVVHHVLLVQDLVLVVVRVVPVVLDVPVVPGRVQVHALIVVLICVHIHALEVVHPTVVLVFQLVQES